MSFLILPGFGGSGPAHWQSRWEARVEDASRFAPASWDRPDLEDWLAALERGLEQAEGPVVLVAHSLACLLTAHWAARQGESVHVTAGRIAGALLVAPPDPEGPAFPREASAGFRDVPRVAFGFPALVLASSNDPYASPAFAQDFAQARGAGFLDIGPCGHINAESGLGDWEEGQRLLAAFAAGCGQPRACM
ncbi:RBBP9/YdeN family alpha/beta hydrolase [Novosphingobium mangrovi (ex Hu et al. 2023)]|uniref:Alpha/beta fold hydrolase n=1 Tax=Novosphingobium mangrovi (ex Hu et al. 2023) TaxID=2930094 RepID=A0ABT0AG69_9SPHN|nr:alpha/beta fold hydrolase [Novosphingobium mangrovi (ex Hu et al. 2023)]MCJ1962190.1 alpha/beta fold hydrolase [Novosphingobium mangrovi (ex Hu et al. 2023)]